MSLRIGKKIDENSINFVSIEMKIRLISFLSKWK